MNETKTYEVKFRITVPEDAEWKDCGFDNGVNYRQIDPSPDDPYVVVPGDAQISIMISDGFYVSPGSRTMYHRHDGLWSFWEEGYWNSSSILDETAKNFDRINVVP
jgi:hypothetical protein